MKENATQNEMTKFHPPICLTKICVKNVNNREDLPLRLLKNIEWVSLILGFSRRTKVLQEIDCIKTNNETKSINKS